MMSYTASAAWSHPVLSLCCTEPDLSRGAVMSGRIIIVAMSRSGQLDQCCTVGKHCSGMHVCRRLSNAQVCLRKYATLATCLGQLSIFFIPMVHNPSGAMGHVTASELTSSRR
jgi:hypothetical protein